MWLRGPQVVHSGPGSASATLKRGRGGDDRRSGVKRERGKVRTRKGKGFKCDVNVGRGFEEDVYILKIISMLFSH